MNNVIEYKTACAWNIQLMDEQVNKLLKEGFQLYGNPYLGQTGADLGPAADLDPSGVDCQAMVKLGP